MNTAAIPSRVNRTVTNRLPINWGRRVGQITTLGLTLISMFLLYLGWLNRTQAVWIAESGWGYWFGIVGGSMMLLLLLYPMRKRFRSMDKWLTTKFWFRVHMVFGVLGPVLIMMHSSFHIGSLNGQVALYSMLLVAFSGLVGRYFYTRVHYGLYGQKATFSSLQMDSKELKKKLGLLFELQPRAKKMLKQYEQQVMEAPIGTIASAWHWVKMRFMSARIYPTVKRDLNEKLLAVAHLKGWDKAKLRRKQLKICRMLLAHRKIVRHILELHFYERLFAIWHMLHIPLTITMVVTGFVHVYAVHAY